MSSIRSYTMGEVIDLDLLVRLGNDSEFISDCCRFSESILTESQVRKKWRLPQDVYEKLGRDDALIEKIEAEKLRRMRSGQQKREAAQLHVTKAPAVLASILENPENSPRHRIDSAKTLNEFASDSPQTTAAAADRFIITINLGSDENGRPVIEHYDKPLAPLKPGEQWSDDGGGNAAQDMIEDATVKRSSAEIACLESLMSLDD
jgi:hypothetical protein